MVAIHERLELRGHSGPLPPPEVFEGYELVLPDASDRILAMAELDARHSQRIEEAALLTYRRETELARLAAMLIPMTGIIAAAIVGINGSPYVAGLLAVGSFSAPFMAALLRQRRDEGRAMRHRQEPDPGAVTDASQPENGKIGAP